MPARKNDRAADALRPIRIETDVNKYAEGSCLIHFGDTQVLCLASVEERVPPFLRNTGRGWVTAEYGMLPRATDTRGDREATRGGQGGRTHEIQRLIGRSLRSVTDLGAFGERQIKVDCDVLQADGGTRTAAITGGYVALALAFRHLKEIRAVSKMPLKDQMAAVSCGLLGGEVLLDLDYAEDSKAEADANFVLTSDGRVIEVQGTAEQSPFAQAAFLDMLALAQRGIAQLAAEQARALELKP